MCELIGRETTALIHNTDHLPVGFYAGTIIAIPDDEFNRLVSVRLNNCPVTVDVLYTDCMFKPEEPKT